VIADSLNIPRFRHHAMATIFEVMIDGEKEEYATQAAAAVFEEIDRLELDLSRFLPNSDISRINNLPPHGFTPVSEATFECLAISRRCWEETGGAFDITLGALMEDLLLDETSLVVGVGERRPRLDLGAVGKGYAVDRALALLKEWGIGSALVHGGTSTAGAYGGVQGAHGWPLTISSFDDPSATLKTVHLAGEALSGSGVRKGLHIIDPRTRAPARLRNAAWAVSKGAAESDAYSTACMVLDREAVAALCERRAGLGVMIIDAGESPEPERLAVFGTRWSGSGDTA
jgi:FAD:protein FMN transferase